MSLIFGLPEDISKRFEKVIEDANREYARKIKTADRVGVNAFGYELQPPWEREEQRVTVKTQAALEYFGVLLLFVVEAFSLLETSDKELLSRVNPALAVIRKVTLDHRWPDPKLLRPDLEEREELRFDCTLIQWLENQEKWQKYEARVVPHIEVPTVDHGFDHENSDPLLYFPVWPLENLSAQGRNRIKVGLTEIHGAFLDDKVENEVECWRRAYDLIADEFNRARLLSEDLVNNRIPEMIADIVAGGGWSDEPMGRARPTAVFSVRLGSQFYPLWRRVSFLESLRGRIAHWSSRPLMKGRATTPLPPPRPSRILKAHRRAILKDFMKKNSLDSMDALARALGVSKTALNGMIRGDRKRYSVDKLALVLGQIGCPSAKWDRAAKSSARA